MDEGASFAFPHAADVPLVAFARFCPFAPDLDRSLHSPSCPAVLQWAVCCSFLSLSPPAFFFLPILRLSTRKEARLAARFQYLGFCPIRFLSFFKTFMRVGYKMKLTLSSRPPAKMIIVFAKSGLRRNAQKSSVHFQILHRFC